MKINDTVGKLEKLWTLLTLKDSLQRQNLKIQYVPATAKVTDALEQHIIQELDDNDVIPQDTSAPTSNKSQPATNLLNPL